MRCRLHPHKTTKRLCRRCGLPYCSLCLGADEDCSACARIEHRDATGSTLAATGATPLYGGALLLVSFILALVGGWAWLGELGQKDDVSRAAQAIIEHAKPQTHPVVERQLVAAFGTWGSAIELWRHDHDGTPPPTHEDIPKWKQLPDDPYRPGQPLTYAVDALGANRPLLYSVGPDGIDDGGLPYDPISGRGDRNYVP